MPYGLNNAKTKLTDDEVDMIRDLYEADRFKPRGVRYWSTSRLAEKFEVSKRYVILIVNYQARVAPLDKAW
jgi:hypothetical protein